MPFAGTAIGAAGVFFLKKKGSVQKQRTLMGFAAGVMTAASVWSLLIPAVEQSASWGRWAFLPAAIGFAAGVYFLLLVDAVSPRLLQARSRTDRSEHWRRTLLMILAVTIHNLPEGMAVGAAYAGVQSGYSDMAAGAMALSLGVAIQNFPEGAIISMPLHTAGMKKEKHLSAGCSAVPWSPSERGLLCYFRFC